MNDKYTLPLSCTNCGHHWTGSFPKGQPFKVAGSYNGDPSCPKCGCHTVVKGTDSSPRWNRDRGPWMDIRSVKKSMDGLRHIHG